MKIVLHCNEYTPCLLPGTKRIRVFYKVLKERGHDVIVLTSKANQYLHECEKYDAPDTIYCPAVPLKKKNIIYRMLNPITFNISALRACRKLGDCDVVLTTSPPILISKAGYRIAKKTHAKLIYDVRDIWPDVALEMGSFTENSAFCRLFRKIADFMYAKADLITAVSPGKVTKLQGYLPEAEKNKVRLLENGLDEEFLKQEIDNSVIERFHMRDKFTVVYTGNIGLAQGLKHLLDLAKKVEKPDVQFLLFGPGAEKEMLRQYAKDNNITNIYFEGIVSEREVFSLLSYAQLAYIPLVNSNLKDSIPTKTYEALGAGCLVLMVADGDAPKLVEECKLGKSISPDEIEKLEETFLDIYSNYDKYAENKAFAQRMILEKHSRQQVALELEKMIGELK